MDLKSYFWPNITFSSINFSLHVAFVASHKVLYLCFWSTHFKRLNFSFDFFFDSWDILTCVTEFSNIWRFSR